MKQLFLIVLLLMAATFAKSSRSTPSGMRTGGGWSAPAKRPGSDKANARYTPPPSSQMPKINTSALSNPNRSMAPTKTLSPVATPSPVKVVTDVPGKINTSSLSDPNRPKVVVAPPAPPAPKPAAPPVAIAQAPAPAAVQTQVKNVTVVKHTYVNHRYDNGYRFTPAPVIIVGGHPTYHYQDHDYPIIMRNGAYYADVNGRPVEFAQADGGWGEVAPVAPTPVVAANTPVVQPAPKAPAPPKTLEVKNSFSDRHPIIYTLLILMAIGLVGIAGYVLFKLIRGDSGK